MDILSWNVNGIRAVQKKGFKSWLEKRNPDILCLQETKAQPDQFPEELQTINGYHLLCCSAEKKGYSGVCVYTKKKPENVDNGFGIEKFDREGRTLILDFGTWKLLNIYYPNGKMGPDRLKYKLEFYDAFLNYIKRQRKPLIICGDVNTAHKEIDLARPKENEDISGFLPEERAWLDKFLKEGDLIDSFRHLHPETVRYSWWSLRSGARARNVGWRIDYFYLTKDLLPKLKEAFILNEVQGSDHCPIGIRITL